MAEIVFQSPAFLIILPILWLILVVAGWRRRFKPFAPFLVRLIIVVLIVVALAHPTSPASDTAAVETFSDPAVLLVDQSDSLSEIDRTRFREEAVRLTTQFPNNDILYFADQATLTGVAETADQSVLALNPEVSNISDALNLGAELLNNESGRLLLLSDGVDTSDGDLERTLDQLTRQDIPVDVLIGAESLPLSEVRVVSIDVPPILREGETFDVEIVIHSTASTEVNLQLIQNSTILAEDVTALDVGGNQFTFTADATMLGSNTFDAIIKPVQPEQDQEARNNIASAFTQVYPPPTVLVVADEPVLATEFAAELEQAGFITNRIQAQNLPTRLSDLEPYAGMVLVDVSARSLQLEQMLAIQEFVRSLGRGLVVTGGRHSYSLGAYDDTPLVEVLPLDMDPPPRDERPPVALLLVIDHSGSMDEGQKLPMAQEAAIRATEILGPDDLIGVLIFDNRFQWVVPFQPVSDGATLLGIQTQIATTRPGGGTRILQALEVGIPNFVEEVDFDGPKLTVLFSDGKSFDGDGNESYDPVINSAKEVGITISTIGIGSDLDTELLEYLAEQGGGRYYLAENPEQLPELTISESDILRSDAVQEGEFIPAVLAPHPILRGLTAGNVDPQRVLATELPQLSGYVAMTPKPQAEVVLHTGPEDALLTVWGYGLGRVAAWSSDTGVEWAASWNEWPESSRFWGQVTGYTIPAPNLGLLQLRADVATGGVVTLRADGVTALGETVDLAPTQATLITPGEQNVPITLRQIAPGQYQQQIQLDEPGAYQLMVAQTRLGDTEERATTGFVVPYPAEYALSDDAQGITLLQSIATATGGRTFSFGETLPPIVCDDASEDCLEETLRIEVETGTALWPWFLLAALILWPLEVFLRRLGGLRIQ